MHLDKHFICGVHITDRFQHAVQVQEALTKYGRFIRTRLGLHDTGSNFNSSNGLLLIEFVDNEPKFAEFLEQMGTIEGLEVQKMVFDHA
ncbi:hypothetical protein CSB45_06900 [candidate division KSB3 bacterium]|uniref:DUF4911 domain-containing protein n=1 Tax=candidate division KSB3 bacterium TaxID=2044937 RepID=A0A2G6E645_9BACT|nr:MAG: hypothetical protein CSB45_06900 [candidate division KSB3 bacterium]PIE30037.1 MAG: hypothetical protein CSA57_05695 [candidate division KSB3 bacterium]